VDIRRLYRRRHSLVPKAPALLGHAAVRLWNQHTDENLRSLAEDALETLLTDTTCGEDAWGYPWDVQTRWSYYPAGSPNVVATAFAADALNEGSVVLDRPEWCARAKTAALWTRRELYLSGEGFFAYHRHSKQLIHNANLLGAALVHTLSEGEDCPQDVQEATARTLDAQRADGTWPYGEGEGLEWVDSYHTGYVLDSLCRLRGVDPRIPTAIERGADAYASGFFGQSGRARLWREKRFPTDAHSAGTGLTVLTGLAELGLVPASTVRRVARYTLGHLIDRSGHAIFRRWRLGRSHVHYIRWSDAPVALGLATAASLF
jgi:hypothetical protein